MASALAPQPLARLLVVLRVGDSTDWLCAITQGRVGAPFAGAAQANTRPARG